MFLAVLAPMVFMAGLAFSSVKSLSIVRINGARFEKFETTVGNVFVPSNGLPFNAALAQPMCPKHIKSSDEVITLRTNVALEPEKQQAEADIEKVARKCAEGEIDASRLAQKSPSGLEVEVTAEKKDPEKPWEKDAKPEGTVGFKAKTK